jgi:hypothetical protein
MKLMKLVKVLIGHISETVNQFCMLQNGHTTSYENKLDDLLLCLHLLLISSAECERCMNHTNALEVITTCDLLIKVNGPPFAYFPAERYAMQWIKKRRHSALDNPSGRPATELALEHHQKLFV